MKKRKIVISTLILLIFLLGLSCQATSFGKTPTPTPDTNATVNAAVAATDNAETVIQSTVDSAVSATITALPPFPSPTPVDTDILSEEELATAVDESVQEANNACQQSSDYSDQATNDDTLTYEEAAELAYYYGVSQAEIEEALYLAELYLDLYYDLAEDTVELLTIIVEDLDELASYTSEALETLDTVINTLAEGGIVSDELIASLSEHSNRIEEYAGTLEPEFAQWLDGLKGSLENRANQYINLEPDQVAGDRLAALDITRDFVNAINLSLGDGILSQNELFNIAQLGANASASINQFGGPQLQNLSGNINALTGQLARGELPQARTGAGELSSLIPRR